MWAVLPVAFAASRARADLSEPTPPPVPRCVEAGAMMLTTLDSATTTAGDAFTFKISGHLNATATTPEIAEGTRGFGVVSFADHAHGSGQPGRLVIEPRYLVMPDGSHVQVLSDPQVADNFAEGSTRNLNGALGFVPGLGLAVGGYNVLHRGREVSISKGTPFNLIVGDQLAEGACFVNAPSALNVR